LSGGRSFVCASSACASSVFDVGLSGVLTLGQAVSPGPAIMQHRPSAAGNHLPVSGLGVGTRTLDRSGSFLLRPSPPKGPRVQSVESPRSVIEFRNGRSNRKGRSRQPVGAESGLSCGGGNRHDRRSRSYRRRQSAGWGMVTESASVLRSADR
jgi:hypothetical protein